MIWAIAINEAIEFNKQRDLASFLVLLITGILALIRLLCYFFRRYNWEIFRFHLIVLYLLSLIQILSTAVHKSRQLPEDDQEGERASILELGSRQMTGTVVLHIVFLTPSFLFGLFLLVSSQIMNLILIT